MKKSIAVMILLVLATFSLEFVKEFKLKNELTLVFCDVGQGDGAFIRTPSNKKVLIDTGPDSQILKCISSNMPFWDRKIDLIILSHFNIDHVAGVVDILNRYNVKNIAVPTLLTERDDVKKYMTLFKSKNIDIDDIDRNDTYKIDNEVYIKTIGPKFEQILIEDNDSSLVQILTYKDFDVLFTGDASYDVLNPLFEDLNAEIEVLKVPHHGSKTGLDANSFKSFKPKIAVISSGEGNSYGHPTKEILNLLEINNIQVRRTDQEGSVRYVLE